MLFERIIPSRLFFLESISIFSPCQAGFRSRRSTLDKILLLFQSILDGLANQAGLSLLSTYRKLSTLFGILPFFHKFTCISAGFSPCFVCVVFQNHKSCSFRVRRDVLQKSVLGHVLFSLFVDDLSASLPSSVNYSLC